MAGDERLVHTERRGGPLSGVRRRARWLWWLVGLLVGLPAGAQSPPAPATGAPVVAGGVVLFHVRVDIGAVSADERARLISTRLARVVDDLSTSGASVTLADRGTYTEILVGRTVVMAVAEPDAAAARKPRAELAAEYADRIRTFLDSGVWVRRNVLRRLGYALLTTLLLAIVVAGLWWLGRKVAERIGSIGAPRVGPVRFQSAVLLSAARVAAYLLALVKVLRWILLLIALQVYVTVVLSFFPRTEGWSTGLYRTVLSALEPLWTGTVSYLPALIVLIVLVLVTRYLLKLVHLIFREIGKGRISVGGFYPEWAAPTYRMLRLLVLALAAIVAFPYLPGSTSPAFQGVSIFLGVLISLGSTSAVANFVAGTILTYMRALHVGDRVQIGEAVGDVVEKTLLVSRLRTIKNVIVTIPNSILLSTQIVNYSTLAREDGLVLHTTVTIGYGEPWRTVHALLIDAARATPQILERPAPFVLQTALNDFFVTYEINAYTDDANRMAETYSALHQNIQDSFNQAGVEIMSPHYTALRDGNDATIPGRPVPEGHPTPAFRVRAVPLEPPPPRP